MYLKCIYLNEFIIKMTETNTNWWIGYFGKRFESFRVIHKNVKTRNLVSIAITYKRLIFNNFNNWNDREL